MEGHNFMSIKKVDGVFRNLPVTSLLKAFQVVEDDYDKVQFSNIFRSYNASPSIQTNSFMFEWYTIEGDEFLDDISSKYYGTPTLWWVIADFNEIVNPYESVENGMSLKILRSDYLYTVFDDLGEIGDL